jgi:hypothetical protein
MIRVRDQGEMRLDGLNIFALQNVKIHNIDKVNKVMSQSEIGRMLSDMNNFNTLSDSTLPLTSKIVWR